MLNIQPQEVQNKRVVGTLDGKDVYQIGLKGGLFILARTDGVAKLEIIGSGAHAAVAKYIAKKLHPRLIITELLKSEGVQEAHYISQVPFYVDLTKKLNSALNG